MARPTTKFQIPEFTVSQLQIEESREAARVFENTVEMLLGLPQFTWQGQVEGYTELGESNANYNTAMLCQRYTFMRNFEELYVASLKTNAPNKPFGQVVCYRRANDVVQISSTFFEYNTVIAAFGGLQRTIEPYIGLLKLENTLLENACRHFFL